MKYCNLLNWLLGDLLVQMPPEATTCFLHNLFIEHILLGLLYLNVTRFRFSHVALRYDALTETVMNKELLTN